jgi:hypothetical protein
VKEPIALAALKALTAHLEGIKPTNGYDFDLQGRVFRGRVRFGHGEPLPMLSILEAPRPEDGLLLPVAGESSRHSAREWGLLVQGWAVDDPENPTDPAYYLMAAVERRLSDMVAVKASGQPVDPAAYLLGRTTAGKTRISTATIGPGLVRPPQEGISDTAFFYLPVSLQRTVDPANPYE